MTPDALTGVRSLLGRPAVVLISRGRAGVCGSRATRTGLAGVGDVACLPARWRAHCRLRPDAVGSWRGELELLWCDGLTMPVGIDGLGLLVDRDVCSLRLMGGAQAILRICRSLA